MTEVILTRHGETEWNTQGRMQGRGDSPLTEAGRAQALLLKRRLDEGGTLGAPPPNPGQRAIGPLESHCCQYNVSGLSAYADEPRRVPAPPEAWGAYGGTSPPVRRSVREHAHEHTMPAGIVSARVPSNPGQRAIGPLESPVTDAARPGCESLADCPGSSANISTPGLSFDAIFVSPQKRAVDTALILRGDTATPIIEEPLLCEIALANWEGLTFHEARALEPERFALFMHTPEAFEAAEGGENFHDVMDRAARFWAQLAERGDKHHYERLLCVTHGITLLALYLSACGLPVSRLREFHAHNLSYSRFILSESRVEADVFDDTSHITDER